MCWFGVLFKGSCSELLLGMVWFSEERATAAVLRRHGDGYREPSLTVPEEFQKEGSPDLDAAHKSAE